MLLTSIWLVLFAAQPAISDNHREHAGHGDRQQQVAQRGAMVMPFDLERTTHKFRPLPDGGVQIITSDDGDLEQIALIRSHLRQVATSFAAGDYASPAAIHGSDMPGLLELRSGAAQIRIAYEDIQGGARVRFVTPDGQLVAAVHRWFAAQRSDHGRHASTE